MAQAGVTVLFNQFLTGMVDTGGNVGETFKRITSKEGMTQTATSMFTAGALEYLNTLTFGQNGLPLGKIEISNSPFTDVLGKNLIYGVTGAAVRSALTGESFEDQLPAVFTLALLQSGAASAAFAIGDTKSLSSNMNLFLHTALGCGIGAIKQDSSEGCAPGALGALASKIWANENGAQIRAESATDAEADTKILDQSTFAGTIAGCIVGGPEGCDTGGMTGRNAVAENYLNNTQWKQLSDRLDTCKTDAECAQVRKEFVELHAKQDAALREACKDLNSQACRTKIAEAREGSKTQQDLVLKGLLPDYYLWGSDWNANANLYAKNAFLSDLKAECARNARCDAKKTESLIKLGSLALDFVPVIGDIKAFVEAETPFDYLLATVGIPGPVGDSFAKVLREGRALYKAGDMTGATAKLDEAKKIATDGGTGSAVVADAAGGAKNPLLADSMPRNGDRLVLNQGNAPTCGANSCGMVLDTLGRPVDVATLIQKIPPNAEGIYPTDVAALMKSQGVDATAFSGRNVNDLARYTQNGTPVVVRIADPGVSDFSHFVVVDGVTMRNGVQVVAIRDPQGAQYFSPVTTFNKSFTGEVIVPKSATTPTVPKK